MSNPVILISDTQTPPPTVMKEGETSQSQVDDMFAIATIQEPPLDATVNTGVFLGATTFDKDKGFKGSKRARASAVQWDDKSTQTLLKVYEEQWMLIKKGNLSLKDWETLTYALNKEIDGSYNLEQARNRIDTLKKTHKKELRKVDSTGSTPSTWPLFDTCEALWGKNAKNVGIAGALESDAQRASSAATDVPNDLDCQEGGSTSQNPQVEATNNVDLDGIFRKKVKQATRSSLDAIARTMSEGMKEMCVAFQQAEEKKTAVLQELEISRMAHEERLVRIKEEEETKRQQMYVAMQLEIAKLLAGGRTRR